VVQHTRVNKNNSAHKQNKDKNHMIISVEAENAFNKIQHLFMIKIPEEEWNRGNTPQHKSQHHSKQEKTETMSSEVRKKQGCLLSPLLFNVVLDLLARVIGQEKEKGSK
jgi:hypothetical protein